MSRIVCVTSSQAFEQRLRSHLEAAAGDGLQRVAPDSVVASPTDFARTIRGDTDVVSLGSDLPTDIALKAASELDACHPTVSILLLAEPSGELWQEAMDAGVRAILRPSTGDDELTEAFRRALDTASRRREALHPPERDGPTGRVITVLGPKGGAGKTVIAANLAVGLAESDPDNVAVLDLDLQFGDLTSAMQLVPEHHLAELASLNGELDPTTLKVFLTAHPAHLYVMAAPPTPAAGEEMPPGRVTETLELLGDEFGSVVVDTSAGIDEHALTAVERSTDLVLVCTMDVASVRALRKLLDSLDAIGMTRQTRHIVLNRADSRVGLSVEDIEATLGTPVNLGLPSSRAVPQSMNEGTTLLERGEPQRLTRQLRELVGRFVDLSTDKRGGLFSLRRSR